MAFQYKKPIIAYRIGDNRHPIFSGEGAQKYGGRWNPIGKAAIYASLNLASAMLEQLIRLNDTPLPNTHQYIEITSTNQEIAIEEVELKDIKAWDYDNISEMQEYGDNWINESRTAILIVPSIILPIEKNVIINPQHSDFKLLNDSSPQLLQWDHRLF